LPSDAALVAGEKTFSVTLNTAGTKTVTASDVTDGTRTANTSASITVNAGTAAKIMVTLPGQTFTSGTGNSGMPAEQTVGAAFNITLTADDLLQRPGRRVGVHDLGDLHKRSIGICIDDADEGRSDNDKCERWDKGRSGEFEFGGHCGSVYEVAGSDAWRDGNAWDREWEDGNAGGTYGRRRFHRDGQCGRCELERC
jgi:hypothetical protein